MKKLSYKDKLLELAYIYSVKEIQDYTKRRKNLTTGQIELILKKNKIAIPKERWIVFDKDCKIFDMILYSINLDIRQFFSLNYYPLFLW